MLAKEESEKSLENFFKKNKFATMNELMLLLRTTNRMSVFRRLCNLDYMSSFSASGKYYTLKKIALFDRTGIWILNNIGFSCHGNLKDTLIYLVEESEVGVTYNELKEKLKINLREALHHALYSLIGSGKISRIIIPNEKIYLYTSEDEARAKKQISNRDKINVSWQESDFPDFIIIEILASIIRTNQVREINSLKIILELKARKIIVTENQVEHVLNKFDLKKHWLSSDENYTMLCGSHAA